MTGVLVPANASVAVGATAKLPAIIVPFGAKGATAFSSSATNKATISDTGVITGVATGSTTITVTVNSTYTATCAVTVVAGE